LDTKMMKYLERFQDSIPNMIDFALKIILAIIVYYIGTKVIKWICRLFQKFALKQQWNEAGSRFIISVTKVALYFFLVTNLAVQLGIKEASIVAVIGSAGVGVSLALQGGLSNLAGGVLILMLKPFELGDYIIQSAQGNEGTVKRIDMFYTTLLTVDNRKVVIPNSTLTNTSLINVTAQDRRQLEIKVGISYNADLKKAKEIVTKLLEEDKNIMSDLPEQVFVDELAESSVVIGFRAWVSTDLYWPTKWHMNEAIKLAFDENGIEIPYNQLDVHVKSLEEV
jgi:small conductance mechanosensitive channel